MAEKTVRTRFAPSPTGYLHVGGVRTALFAWLVAQQTNGQFILRIEDTDRERHNEEAETHIIESLRWLELQWDEGPDIGGPHGPYRQSERLDIYKDWAQRLVDSGRAYPEVYSPSELEGLRLKAKQAKKAFLYRDHRPAEGPAWDGQQALRFKSEPKDYTWQDEVMGEMSSGQDAVDDFIILKADGFPTYNFAHVVDDHLMEVSLVVRSQEFLPSVPKFLNLYEALAIKQPKLATLPYVMAAGGNKKLSKRDGAKDVLDYQREGYLPEVLVNFLATLGWNDGTEQEIFSVKELVAKFRLDRVQKSGAHFDERRLQWLNGHYIRQLPLDELYARSKSFWPESAKTHPEEYRKQVLALVQERLKHLSELPSLTSFFFKDLPVDLALIDDNKLLNALGREGQKELLGVAVKQLSQSDFSKDALDKSLNQLLEQTSQKPAVLFSLIRVVTTWAPASPGLADTLALLGKQKSLARMEQAVSVLSS